MLECRHLLWGVGSSAQLALPLRRSASILQPHCGSSGNALTSQPKCRVARLHRRCSDMQQASAGQQSRMSRIPSASALCVEPAHADELHHGDLRDAELGADILQAELNTLSRALEELAALQKFPDEPTMDSDEYPGTEIDRETLEQQWNQAEERDGLDPASEASRGHLPQLTRSDPASAFGASAPSQPQTVRPGPSAPLPQAPDLQLSSSPAEAALVSSDVETLERALAAPTGNQRGKLAASRRSRSSGWGKRTADSRVDELNAMREDSSVTSSADVMKGFMRRAGKFKLLSGDEEKELGRHIQRLTALKAMAVDLESEFGREPTLKECAAKAGLTTPELRKQYSVGQTSKQRMMDCNLRLVVSISRKYISRGLPLEDLVAEGVTGLSSGIDRFDPGRGFKLSTYVHWWIRQAVARCIQDQARVVRLPVHLHDMISRIRKTELQLFNQLNRRATQSEIAEHLGLSLARLRLLNKAARQPTSTSAPLGQEADGETVEDVIEDEDATVDELVLQRLLAVDVDNVLHTLSPRECGVLRMRYGLDDGVEKTLEEIGYRYKVTRERIRQIECKALRKMKQPMRQSALKDYERMDPEVDFVDRKVGGGMRSG